MMSFVLKHGYEKPFEKRFPILKALYDPSDKNHKAATEALEPRFHEFRHEMHPIILVSKEQIMAMSKLEKFGEYGTMNETWENPGWGAGKTFDNCVFVSHVWVNNKPDHDGSLLRALKLMPAKAFWIDYCCVDTDKDLGDQVSAAILICASSGYTFYRHASPPKKYESSTWCNLETLLFRRGFWEGPPWRIACNTY